MVDEAKSEGAARQLTPEQMRRVRTLGLLGSPFRVIPALLVLSLAGGLPWNLFAEPYGWALAGLVLLKDLAEYAARVPSLSGRLREERGEAVLVWLAVQLPLVAAVADRAHLPELLPRSVALLAGGTALAFAGVLFRAWSVRTLGVFFTLAVRVHEGHQLVENGPYRWLRHPAYTGSLLYLLGVSLTLSSVAGIACVLLVALPAVLVRIRREELVLRRRLGDVYREYMKRTRRLV